MPQFETQSTATDPMPFQLTNAQPHKNLSQQQAPNRHFQVLRQVGEALSATAEPSFSQACKVIASEVANWAALDLFLSQEEGDLVRVAEAGNSLHSPCPPFDEHYLPRSLLPLESPCILSAGLRSKEWVLRPNLKRGGAFAEQMVVISPLLFAGQCLGVLSFGWRFKAPPECIDTAFVSELTRFFSFAAQHLRLQSEARQVRSMRDEMLSVVSHDLKNPLTAMLVSASLLEERADRMGDDPGNRFKKLSTSIRRSAERMNGLLSDLVDIVRVEAGRLKLDSRPAELSALIDEAVTAAGPLSEQRSVGIEVIHAGAAGRAWVLGDHARLVRVASNLLTCAMQATPAGGTVTVALRLDLSAGPSGSAELEIIDGGGGGDEAQQSTIFNALLHTSEQAKGPAGLTLTASKGIIEHHGGRLEIIPHAGGNCLRCVLPLSASPVQA